MINSVCNGPQKKLCRWKDGCGGEVLGRWSPLGVIYITVQILRCLEAEWTDCKTMLLKPSERLPSFLTITNYNYWLLKDAKLSSPCAAGYHYTELWHYLPPAEHNYVINDFCSLNDARHLFIAWQHNLCPAPPSPSPALSPGPDVTAKPRVLTPSLIDTKSKSCQRTQTLEGVPFYKYLLWLWTPSAKHYRMNDLTTACLLEPMHGPSSWHAGENPKKKPARQPLLQRHLLLLVLIWGACHLLRAWDRLQLHGTRKTVKSCHGHCSWLG